MKIDAPLIVHRERVRPEWIDYNGHMNVAFYLMAADHAMDSFSDYIGLGQAYMKNTNKSTFALDTRIIYLRELMVDSPIRIAAQLVSYDLKRIHVSLSLIHDEENWVSALNEWVLIHVDLSVRRATQMPSSTLTNLEDIMDAHKHLERPKALIRSFGLL